MNIWEISRLQMKFLLLIFVEFLKLKFLPPLVGA